MSRKVLLFLFSALAYGQNTTAPAAPLKIGSVTVTGSIRSRLEAWDWFTADTGDNSYAYNGNIFRIAFAQSKENWDWQLEMAAPVLLGLPSNSVAPGAQGQLGLGATYYLSNNKSQNSAMIFPKQGYIRFKNLFGDSKQSLRVGRIEFVDGAEIAPKNATLATIKKDRISMRLIGHFGWGHVGRSFDGANYVYNSPKNGNFTFIGGIPTRGVFQTDGWGWMNTGLGYAAYSKGWGTGIHAADTRVFAMYYQDWRATTVKTDNRPLAARRADTANLHIYSFGGHSIHAIDTKKGTVDLLAWGTGQTGKWGIQDHRAYAVAFEGGFQPKIAPKLKPWFRAGFYNGSGDDNPNDKTHGAFFQVMPTPRPYARFPFFDMMNNQDINAAMILRPHKQVTISSEFHSLRLSNKNDLWYSGGGAYQPWTFGYQGRATNGNRSLANLYDTSLEYRVNPHLSLTGYYGYADGRAVTTAIYPKGKNGAMGYAEVLYKF